MTAMMMTAAAIAMYIVDSGTPAGGSGAPVGEAGIVG